MITKGTDVSAAAVLGLVVAVFTLSAVAGPSDSAARVAMPAGQVAIADPTASFSALGQYPRASRVMTGSGIAFALSFDRPVDHVVSSFTLESPSGIDRTVRVRLESRPNVLYAAAGHLQPGEYELRWQAKAADGSMLAGALPFKVAP